MRDLPEEAEEEDCHNYRELKGEGDEWYGEGIVQVMAPTYH